MTDLKRILPFIRDLNPEIDDLPKIAAIIKKYEGNRTKIVDHVFRLFTRAKKRKGFSKHSIEANTIPSLTENNLGIMTADGKLTDLGKKLNGAKQPDDFKKILGKHLLVNKAGWQFCRGLAVLGSSGKKVSREELASFLSYKYAIEEWRDLNNISSLHSFLEWIGIVKNYVLNEDRLLELISISTADVQVFEGVSHQAKDLLASLVRLGGEEITGKIRYGAESTTGHRINVHQVPFYEKQLKEAGLIEVETRRGRRDTKWKIKNKEKVDQLVALSSGLTLGPMLPDEVFNKGFKEIFESIREKPGKKIGIYDKGKLLEVFAGKICWLLGLQRILFRRLSEYEVDVSAESVMPIYAPWLIQCKATTAQVNSEVLLREYAIAQLEGSQIMMMVTTADYSADCRSLANKIQRTGRQIILLNGRDLEAISDDEIRIYEIIREQSGRTSNIKRGYNIQDVFDELETMISQVADVKFNKKTLWILVEKSGIPVPEDDFYALFDAWKLQKDAAAKKQEKV